MGAPDSTARARATESAVITVTWLEANRAGPAKYSGSFLNIVQLL